MSDTMRLGSRKFYDDANFAGGIARSGYFTIKEAEHLVSYGHTLNGLVNGQLSPENSEEQNFVEQFQSAETSDLYFVKLWRKYQRALYLSKHKASLDGRKVAAAELKQPVFVGEDDDDVVVDDDDDFGDDDLDDDF